MVFTISSHNTVTYVSAFLTHTDSLMHGLNINNEERREQTKLSRNEDVEMGKREDQVGSHQK